jgi:BolA protein
MREMIEKRLREAFAPSRLEVSDDSAEHRGHPGSRGGGHFTAVIVSQAFEGLGQVDRQRKVYALFAEELRSGAIHALALTTKTPSET